MCLPLLFACSFSPFLPQPTSTATTLPGTQHSTSTSTLFHTDTFLGLCFFGKLFLHNPSSFFSSSLVATLDHSKSLFVLLLDFDLVRTTIATPTPPSQSTVLSHCSFVTLGVGFLGLTLLNTQRFSYFWNPSSPSSRAVRPSTWPRPCSLSRLALFTASPDTRTRFCFRGLP